MTRHNHFLRSARARLRAPHRSCRHARLSMKTQRNIKNVYQSAYMAIIRSGACRVRRLYAFAEAGMRGAVRPKQQPMERSTSFRRRRVRR